MSNGEVVKNINNVVVNRPENPVNKVFARVFNFYKKYPKMALEHFVDIKYDIIINRKR